MANRHSLRQRLHYRFDNLLARGTISLVLWLALGTLLLIGLAGLALWLTGITPYEDKVSFIEGMWLSLVRTLDPGVVGADLGWPFRVVGLLVTLGGIFIVSTLIGLLATGISEKLEELRKGRSLVLESAHTLILGWSTKIITIISELMIANENVPDSSIVVLAPEDKVFMEDEIRARVKSNGHTKVICRTGNPADPLDLEIANPLEAKSVVVLAGQEESADAQVIKAVLALLTIDPGFEKLNVVAELLDDKHADALLRTTRRRMSTVVSSDVIARITAQVCRQSGLSAVYQELLDFEGDEIYFASEERLNGMTFKDALMKYTTSSLIGMRFADGRTQLNPSMDTVLASGDEIIAISEDDDTVVYTDELSLEGDGLVQRDAQPEVVERILVLGWSSLGPLVMRQLDQYLAQGSYVHVFFDPAHVDRSDPHTQDDFDNLTMEATEGDITNHLALDALIASHNFDHVIALCYRNMSAADADARTLMTLVQLRQIIRDRSLEGKLSIVTELLEPSDVALAQVANPDDFIISEQLVSLLLAQLAENPKLDALFHDLFDSHQSEMVLKPATAYVQSDQAVPFAAAVRSASHRDEIAIGYRKAAREGQVAEVIVNPNKAEEVRFTEADQLILLTIE